MYIVCSGRLRYVSIEGQVLNVEERAWIAEGTLWTSWMHRGTLTAASDCRLCMLDALLFQDIAGQFDHPDFDPRVYAVAFVKDLNQAKDCHVGDVDCNGTTF